MSLSYKLLVAYRTYHTLLTFLIITKYASHSTMPHLCFVVGVVVRNRILWRILECISQEVKQEIFLYSIAFRPALEPTQPPIQWVPQALGHQGVRLIIHLHLVLMPRILDILPLPMYLHDVELN
jgi:hypothetical protein